MWDLSARHEIELGQKGVELDLREIFLKVRMQKTLKQVTDALPWKVFKKQVGKDQEGALAVIPC